MANKKNQTFGIEFKKISKWHRSLNKQEKTILWIFIGAITLSLCISMLVSTIRTYDSDLSLQQCNQLRIDDVRHALSLQEDNNILAFIYAFQFPFKILLIAIAIAWVIHGVGFHLIKR